MCTGPRRGEVRGFRVTGPPAGRVALVVLALVTASSLAGAAEPASSGSLGETLPIASAAPFAGLLLSIALLPLLAPHFWHRRYGLVAAVWSIVFAAPFLVAHGHVAAESLLEVALLDYVPFIILVSTLFVIAGGVLVSGGPSGTPSGNVAVLVVGSALASLVGTTGAAMLLIRPLLRANRGRRFQAHTVAFFIVLVANVGGSLTPLGDPPLFLGFLHGVPFLWTLGLWPMMLLAGVLLLAVYLVLEAVAWRRETPQIRAEIRSRAGAPLRVAGWHNGLLLVGVLAAVVGSGLWAGPGMTVFGVEQHLGSVLRDVALLGLLATSLATTPRKVRAGNEFSWGPIREVAILFAAIFVTMIPALAMLRAGEAGAMARVVGAVSGPASFFWATGALSSFLDNAPTYLTFLSTALGRLAPGMPERQAIALLIAEHGRYLAAISVGAVFMGANTYIGNAPNFMVRSIAEESGVEMPSFFGYVLRYTVPYLLPVFLVVTWVFFR